MSDLDLNAALHSYLPASLSRACLADGNVVDTRPCIDHLDALLNTIATYLPRQVVEPLMAHPVRGQVAGGFTEGTMMFSDISGFTAMSEKLARLGKAGAEEITAIVNRFFSALLQVTGAYGGDLLKFGGDALLVFFGGQGHAHRACRAALQMQATMARFSETKTSQGTFRLRMTIGLGSGPLFMARLGAQGEIGGQEFAVMGQAMAQMAQAEDQAEAGEIFCDERTQHTVGDTAQWGRSERAFYQLVDLAPAAPGEETPPLAQETEMPDDLLSQAQLTWLLERIRALEAFLPPGLIDKIKIEPERIAIGGEYRPVTVLFANFYGIEEIIQSLGETRSAEVTAILNAHFETMHQIIFKYGGVVNKVDSYAVGHRIMALFGAPRAHIDDPERAVRAALEMQQAMASFAELDASCGTFCLKQRIGINTGLVFAGNVGSLMRQEYSVMGDEVNLTARLMAVSADGQVLISQSTAREAGSRFLLHEQTPVKVKGKTQPVPNYEVLGLQETRGGALHPMIGRDQEWAVVHELSEASLTGQRRILTLVGDVGMGKSRLLQELEGHWQQAHNGQALVTACPSFGRHTPYLPWLDLLRQIVEIDAADSVEDSLGQLDRYLRRVDPTWTDWTTLIARLLGWEVQESDLVRVLDAQSRQRTIALVVTGLVEHAAQNHPLLVIIDDVQWADDPSVDLINRTARQVSRVPLLIALAHRPDETLELDVTGVEGEKIRLHELDDESSLHLLDTLLPTTPEMPKPLKRLILDKARGNPLFIDAIAHALIEQYMILDPSSGTYRARQDLAQIEVPDSVNRVIMSRIDRLEESSRNVLRVASVIGQEFERWLLGDVYPYRQAEGELDEHLLELAAREILSGPLSDLSYLFRHILTREVAYESLLYADRRQLHRRIGQAIEQGQHERLSEYWEVLAYHFELAENWSQALSYHARAGRKAASIYANEEAIHHLERALYAADHIETSVLPRLELHSDLAEVLETVAQYQNALEHNTQARQLLPASGMAQQERARRRATLYHQAASIYEKQSDYEEAFRWLQRGLETLGSQDVLEKADIYVLGAGLYYRQGQHNEAIAWCEKSLGITQTSRDPRQPSVLAHTYYLLGLAYSRLGDPARTIDYCQQSLAIYEQIEDVSKAADVHSNLANGYFDRGDWELAREHYQQALDIKRRIGDVYHQAVVTLNLGGIFTNQGDLDQADEAFQRSLAMWQEIGSTYAIALLHNNLGTVALRRGELTQALELLNQSRELFTGLGSTDFMPEVCRQIAEVYLAKGEIEQALENGQHSLDLAREHDMRLEAGITHRVLGQIHLARQDLSQAALDLETSLEILETLDSRYEIGKTLFQIARLRQKQGQHAPATQALEQAVAIFKALGARLDLEQAKI